jgi:hypothetical protein
MPLPVGVDTLCRQGVQACKQSVARKLWRGLAPAAAQAAQGLAGCLPWCSRQAGCGGRGRGVTTGPEPHRPRLRHLLISRTLVFNPAPMLVHGLVCRCLGDCLVIDLCFLAVPVAGCSG